MKKFILILVAALCLSSCVEKKQTDWLVEQMAANSTPYLVVQVPRGQEVIDYSWRNQVLTYMIKPMDDDYVPTTKRVMASFIPGGWETTVVFQESR